MATRIPDPLKRRHLIEGRLDPERARALGLAYLEQRRTLEAVAFLQRAEATDELERVLEEAIEAGDAFLVREVAAALGRGVDSTTWRRVAEAAEREGKESYAADALRHAELLER